MRDLTNMLPVADPTFSVVPRFDYKRLVKGLSDSASLSNPQFDARIYNVRTATGEALSRGVITEYNANPNALVHKVNFLYNPSEVSISHSVDPSIVDSAGLSANDTATKDVGALSASTQFSLLFDRTYETWDQSYVGSNPGEFGVYADVRAFYRMLKIVTNDAQLLYEEYPSGFMQLVPVTVHFGRTKGFSIGYFGYITNLDITYTHFTTKMVPNRCVVNVSMNIYPLPSAS